MNETRTCPKCKKTGSREMWPPSMLSNRKLYGWCRKCRKEIDERYRKSNRIFVRRSNAAWKRTIGGLIRTIYHSQAYQPRSRSKIKYVNYSFEQFEHWIKCPKFFELYEAWQESGYSKWMKPSVDRIDPSGHYCIGNIEIMTWKENDEKGKLERRKKCDTIKFA